MRGLYFDYLDKPYLQNELDKALYLIEPEHSESKDQDLFIQKLKKLDCTTLFARDQKSFFSEYKIDTDLSSVSVVKTQETPPRYIYKKALTGFGDEEAVFTLAFTVDAVGNTELTTANIVATTPNTQLIGSDLGRRELYPWTKTEIHEAELYDWAAAEYFNYSFYTEDPLNEYFYGRILNDFGSNTTNREKLLRENPLFFPLNRLLHKKSPAFALPGLVTLPEMEHRLRQPREREYKDLHTLLEEKLQFSADRNRAVHQRIIRNPLLKEEYEKRCQFLKEQQKHDKFANDAIVSYDYALAQVVGNNHLALSAAAQGIYQQRTQHHGADVFTNPDNPHHADCVSDIHIAGFTGQLNVICRQGAAFTDDQMRDAYRLYKGIIQQHFAEYLEALLPLFNPAVPNNQDVLQIARFLLLNPELNRSVREANSKWYYQLMMHIGLDALRQIDFPEKELFISSLSGKATHDLTHDSQAALALFADDNTFLDALTLTQSILNKYHELEDDSFYELIMSPLVNASIFNESNDKDIRTIQFPRFSASKKGNVSYCFEHDLLAVKALIATDQINIAKSIFDKMYASDYYHALNAYQKTRLNEFTAGPFNGEYAQQKRQLATLYYANHIGYFGRYNELRAQHQPWYRAFVNAFYPERLVMDNARLFSFERPEGALTLAGLKKHSPEITTEHLAPLKINTHKRVSISLSNSSIESKSSPSLSIASSTDTPSPSSLDSKRSSPASHNPSRRSSLFDSLVEPEPTPVPVPNPAHKHLQMPHLNNDDDNNASSAPDRMGAELIASFLQL